MPGSSKGRRAIRKRKPRADEVEFEGEFGVALGEVVVGPDGGEGDEESGGGGEKGFGLRGDGGGHAGGFLGAAAGEAMDHANGGAEKAEGGGDGGDGREGPEVAAEVEASAGGGAVEGVHGWLDTGGMGGVPVHVRARRREVMAYCRRRASMVMSSD